MQIDALRDEVLSWHIPDPAPVIRGARLYKDAPRRGGELTAIVRQVLRTNERLAPTDALFLSWTTLAAAHRHGVAPGLLAATLLQESAYDPVAMSAAGAFGIGQFTIDTADIVGVEPLDPASAIDGTARLLARYHTRYAARPDWLGCALAAYNAGPEAVTRYDGVPPYAETREYVSDIIERWSRIVRDR